MTDCVFCRIRDGQIPSMKVYEDDRTLCIMDINPLNAGHCLVLMKAHAATIWDATETDLAAAMMTVKRVAAAIRTTLKPDGLTVVQTNGQAAFQSVPHLHLHLIPRWTNDGKGLDWVQVPGERESIMEIGARLRAAISPLEPGSAPPSGGGARRDPASPSPRERAGPRSVAGKTRARNK